jgi:hypothetical protein
MTLATTPQTKPLTDEELRRSTPTGVQLTIFPLGKYIYWTIRYSENP